MAEFPTQVYKARETENLPGIVYNENDPYNFYSEDFQKQGDELTAIETLFKAFVDNIHIDENGQVSFGSTSHPAPFFIENASGTILRVKTTRGANPGVVGGFTLDSTLYGILLSIGADLSTATVYVSGNGVPIIFSCGPNELLKLTTNDRIGLLVANPTARFHLPAGEASAGGAPFKLTPGTLLTTPEVGALEFIDNGTTSHLYITVNVAGVATRIQIV